MNHNNYLPLIQQHAHTASTSSMQHHVYPPPFHNYHHSICFSEYTCSVLFSTHFSVSTVQPSSLTTVTDSMWILKVELSQLIVLLANIGVCDRVSFAKPVQILSLKRLPRKRMPRKGSTTKCKLTIDHSSDILICWSQVI